MTITWNMLLTHVIKRFQQKLEASQCTLAGPIILGNINEEHPSGLCPSSIDGDWNAALSDPQVKPNRSVTVINNHRSWLLCIKISKDVLHKWMTINF